MQSINQSLRRTALMVFLVKRNKTILSVLVDPGADGPPAQCRRLSALSLPLSTPRNTSKSDLPSWARWVRGGIAWFRVNSSGWERRVAPVTTNRKINNLSETVWNHKVRVWRSKPGMSGPAKTLVWKGCHPSSLGAQAGLGGGDHTTAITPDYWDQIVAGIMKKTPQLMAVLFSHCLTSNGYTSSPWRVFHTWGVARVGLPTDALLPNCLPRDQHRSRISTWLCTTFTISPIF